MTIHLAPNLTLPDDLVTKTVGILAQRRKGKTYTAAVIAEELVDAGIPFVVLDPTGAWWGLRSSADGTKPGLPVTILGGHHGDVPLERTAGKLVAELVVDRPGWYVLDLSLFESKEADRQFATDFAERLYRRKGQEGGDSALHLFVDEADLFVPQQSPSGDKRMVGAFETLVRRGGIRGIGTTLISQRAAVVNKNVLEMLDMLVVLRTVGPNDRKAIDGYIEAFATPEDRKEVMASLASLDIGEAWVYEPGEDLLARVHVRTRRTFNSSATPKAGEVRAEPQRLADVDLDALKDQMAETIEKADAQDPKKLQARIRDLERELRDVRAATPEPERIVEIVDVPLLDPELVEKIELAVGELRALGEHFVERADVLVENLGAAKALHDFARSQPPAGQASAPGARPAHTAAPKPATPAEVPAGDLTLGKGERTVLAVLAQYPDGRTYNELAFLAGYSAKASTLGVILSTLRKAGLVEPGNQPVRPTPEGLAAAGGARPLPTGNELLNHWLNHPRMGEGERKVLRALIDAYPAELTHDELCDRTGYSTTASTIGVILSKLRKLGIVEKGARRVPDEFMDAIR